MFVGRLLGFCRYLPFVAVLCTLVAACFLYAAGFFQLGHILYEELGNEKFGAPEGGKMLAVKFLKMVDLLLIATGFQVMSVGIYKLFIDPEIKVPAVMQLESFMDLKRSIVTITGIVLIIFFLEQAVQFRSGGGTTALELLYMGIGIGAVLFAVNWTTRNR